MLCYFVCGFYGTGDHDVIPKNLLNFASRFSVDTHSYSLLNFRQRRDNTSFKIATDPASSVVSIYQKSPNKDFFKTGHQVSFSFLLSWNRPDLPRDCGNDSFASLFIVSPIGWNSRNSTKKSRILLDTGIPAFKYSDCNHNKIRCPKSID